MGLAHAAAQYSALLDECVSLWLGSLRQYH